MSSKKHDAPLEQHHGIFRRQLSMWESVALIVSGTIGAGVLGIPYAVAKVGVKIGLLYIVVLGALMIGLNLFLGEVTIRTKQKLQLSGLAKKYLGTAGEYLMTTIFYLSVIGTMVVYIIGGGHSLEALFGGSNVMWSVVFFAIGTLLIAIGMRTVKTVELFLTMALLFVVLLIAAWSTPHISTAHLEVYDMAYLFFPYGVILFAFSGATAIPEAHTLLANKELSFKKAIIISGVISIFVYALFAVMVVGVTGWGTTEIATIGLGQSVGPMMTVFGNIFAILAMGTSYLLVGLSLRDSMTWDFKVPRHLSTFLISAIPFTIFILGIRQFITAIDFVGGVFVSLQMLLIILIYWRAKHVGDVKPSKYQLHHVWFLIGLLVLAFSIGAMHSVWKLF